MELTKLFLIASISLFAAISPGPDFAIVVRNCVGKNFRVGLLTALGISCAILIHITYCLFGVGFIIQESPFIFSLIKYAGAIYLFYLGFSLIREKISHQDQIEIQTKKKVRNKYGPFLSGFLCNLLNPKATLFILSIFSQFVDSTTTLLNKFFMGSIFAFVVLCWFSFLSFLITHRFLQTYFTRFQNIIMKIMGVCLCCLGVYIIIS